MCERPCEKQQKKHQKSRSVRIEKQVRIGLYLYTDIFQLKKEEVFSLVQALSEMARLVYHTEGWELSDIYIDALPRSAQGASSAAYIPSAVSNKSNVEVPTTQKSVSETAHSDVKTTQTTVSNKSNAATEKGGQISAESGELKRLIKDIQAGSVDVILVQNVEKIGATARDAEKLRIAAEDTHIPFFVFESKKLVDASDEALKESIRRRADGPKIWRFASPCFGFNITPEGEYIVNEDEASTVRMVFQLRNSLGSDAATAREMTARGIPTARGKNTWSQRGVSILLNNRLYKGDSYLLKDGTVMTSPRLVDETLWREVQEKVESSRYKKRKKTSL